MLKTIAQVMIDDRLAVRMCPPLDGESSFSVSAIGFNGSFLAVGSGETLDEAIHAMLEDLGVMIVIEDVVIA